jgi:hypothetical protein
VDKARFKSVVSRLIALIMLGFCIWLWAKLFWTMRNSYSVFEVDPRWDEHDRMWTCPVGYDVYPTDPSYKGPITIRCLKHQANGASATDSSFLNP